MKTEYTSLPWELSTTKLGDPAIYSTANPKMFICVFAGEGDTDKANAAFIVRAVNAHEELLQALKDVLSCYKRVWADAGKDQNGSLYIGIAEKAIAKAEG